MSAIFLPLASLSWPIRGIRAVIGRSAGVRRREQASPLSLPTALRNTQPALPECMQCQPYHSQYYRCLIRQRVRIPRYRRSRRRITGLSPLPQPVLHAVHQSHRRFVEILNQQMDLRRVAGSALREYVAELSCEVMSVQVLPPSCVNEIVPVPVLRLTYADAQRAADAIPEVGCRMIASAAVAVCWRSSSSHPDQWRYWNTYLFNHHIICFRCRVGNIRRC